MGMAASQARFLGLTARKSNVEYQGQQVNQQRTALATESSNLFHQMMSLDVPTPPVTTDYYSIKYTLDDSAFGNSSDYTIESLTKTYGGTNNYTVKLKTTETSTGGTSNTFQFTKVTRTALTGDDVQNLDDKYSYVTKLNGAFVSYNPTDCTAYQPDSSDKDKNVIKASQNKIYEIDDETRKLLEASNDGYNAVVEQMVDDGIIQVNDDGTIKEKQPDGTYADSKLYFFQDKSGKNCYLTQSQLDRITKDAFSENPGYDSDVTGNVANISGAYTQLYYPMANKTDYYYEVNADIDSSSSGRFTTIAIADPPEDEEEKINYPSNLKGKTFSITCSSEYDEKAYNDAYNDYEFNKNVYEQTIANINAQTEIIQQEDKQLELRLQQLDTEQESIKTEMDSVTKVVEDNIQKTFDAFA